MIANMGERQVAISIVIVNWNSKGFVRKCIESIQRETRNLQYEIIVVDSASFDGCAEMLAIEFPAVQFIQCEENVGFARANNVGFDRSKGAWVLFLNPDTELVGPAINILYEASKELAGAGAVGAKLLNSDGSLQTSCIQAFPTILNQLLDAEALRQRFPKAPLWGIAPLYSSNKKPARAEAISGACIMMKREIFQAVGRFSAGYFMYAEDIDLCYKASRHGCVNYHVPQAAIVHHGDGSVRNASNNFAIVMATESLWRYFKKYRGAGYATAYRFGLLLAGFGRISLLSGRHLLGALRKKHFSQKDSWTKWMAILRWASGRERWVLRYR